MNWEVLTTENAEHWNKNERVFEFHLVSEQGNHTFTVVCQQNGEAHLQGDKCIRIGL